MNEEHALAVVATSSILFVLVIGSWLLESKRGTFDLFALKNIFLLYVLLQFAIWPLLILLSGVQVLYSVLQLTFLAERFSYFLFGQALVIFSVILFMLGHRLGFRPNSRGTGGGEVRVSNILILFALLFSSSVASTAAYLRMESAGGVFYFLQNVDDIRSSEGSGAGIYLTPLFLAQQLALYCLAVTLKRRGLRTWSLFNLLIVTACGLLVGQRLFLLTPVLGTLVIFHRLVKPIKLTPALFLLVFAFVYLNITYANFRSGQKDGQTNVEVESSLPFFGRFHGPESVVRVLSFTDEQGISYGIPLAISIVTGFVPRALWPDKPQSAGIIANISFWPEAFGSFDTSAAVVTLAGELLWHFGLPGIFLGYFFLGYLFGRVQSWDRKSVWAMFSFLPWYLFASFVNETLSLYLLYLIISLTFAAVVRYVFFSFSRPVVQPNTYRPTPS